MRRIRIIGMVVLVVEIVCSGFGPITEALCQQDDSSKYHSYTDTYKRLYQLETDYSQIAKVYDIGDSVEGRDIWAIKISDNPETEEDEAEVLFTGGHHGNEWIATEAPLLLAEYLCQNYGANSEVRSIVDNGEIWIVPMVNPDGHEAKTRTNRRGVDLNRNYDFKWSPEYTEKKFYPGPYPFSEPETKAIRDFILSHQFMTMVDYHSFSKQVLYPWSYTKNNTYNPLFTDLSEQLAKIITDVYYGQEIMYLPLQVGPSRYISTGGFTDWCYGKQGISAFAVELRPQSEGGGGYSLPESEIEPTWLENKPAALYLIGWTEQSKFNTKAINKFVNGTSGWMNFEKSERFFSITIKATKNFQVQIKVEAENGNDYVLIYIPNETEHPYLDKNQIVYSIGTVYKNGNYHTLYRNLEMDLKSVIGQKLRKAKGIQVTGNCWIGGISFWNFTNYSTELDNIPFPKEWVNLKMKGWDFQCEKFTQFKGIGKPFKAYPTPNGIVYEYIFTGSFLLGNNPTFSEIDPLYPPDDNFSFLYHLFGFLKLDENGNLIPTSVRAEKGFDVSPEMPGYPVTFLKEIYSFLMYESEFPGISLPEQRGYSGSLWGDGSITEISVPSSKSIVADGYNIEGLPIQYEGTAYYAYHEDIENADYYLVEGTLYTVVKGDYLSPKRMLGTLKHSLNTDESEMRLESETLKVPVGQEIWESIAVSYNAPSLDFPSFTQPNYR